MVRSFASVVCWVFSDDSANFPASVPHSGENRVGIIDVAFPDLPNVPHYDPRPRYKFELVHDHARSRSFWLNSSGAVPHLSGVVESGVAGDNQGFYFARIAIDYEMIPRMIPINVIPDSLRLQITSATRFYQQSQRGPTHATRIGFLGGKENGVHWKLSTDVAIHLIRTGIKTFFVIGDDGSSADVRIVEPHRTAHDVFYFPHLQTIPDESGRDNLMALPSCPLFWDEP